MACPRVSPTLPLGPALACFLCRAVAAAGVVPWCQVSGLAGPGPLSGWSCSPQWKEYRGLFKAMLAGIPKPQVSSLMELRESTALSMFGLCGDARVSAGHHNVNIWVWVPATFPPPKLWEDPEPPVWGSSRELEVPDAKTECKLTALHVTQGSLLICQGGCASICSHLCSQFETVSKPTKLQLRHLSSPVFCWHLSYPFPPLSHLLCWQTLTASTLLSRSFHYRQRFL